MALMPKTLTASHLKALILTCGVRFTAAALELAREVGAKGLQLVYNAPSGAPAGAPQELLLRDGDGYEACVSLVAPVPGRQPLIIDAHDSSILIKVGGDVVETGVSSTFVLQPKYYATVLPSGQSVTRVVSACGVSEMNIWPWHDCAIGSLCRFCGINKVQRSAGSGDLLSARQFPEADEPFQRWIGDLECALQVAVTDQTYARELFPMIISGNLRSHLLDRQALVYGRIARVVEPVISHYAGPEGLVAMTAPPSDHGLLNLQRDAGVRTMAINLEAWSEQAFRKECAGKDRLGRDRYLSAVIKSVDVFGHGRSWTNFVLGLEPLETLLAGCKELAVSGVSPGASVLHFDQGATIIGRTPPTYEEVLWFYRELADLYRSHGLRPYFSSRALRSSLANEAFDGRLTI